MTLADKFKEKYYDIDGDKIISILKSHNLHEQIDLSGMGKEFVFQDGSVIEVYPICFCSEPVCSCNEIYYFWGRGQDYGE
jgi:hypothetical protein